MGKPSEQEKLNAFIALWEAITSAEKKTVLEKHEDVLLRKYGFWDGDPEDIGLGWLKELGGLDELGVARYQADCVLLKEARKRGIDKAVADYDASLDSYIVALAPKRRKADMSTTVLANVTYFEDEVDPHPVLEHKQDVALVAYPEMLVVRRRRDNNDLLEIPWNNITRARPYFQSRGRAAGLGAALTDGIWAGTINTHHDGVLLQYHDVIFDGELSLFFRVRGKKNAQKLTKALNARVYEYKRKMGQAGGPK